MLSTMTRLILKTVHHAGTHNIKPNITSGLLCLLATKDQYDIMETKTRETQLIITGFGARALSCLRVNNEEDNKEDNKEDKEKDSEEYNEEGKKEDNKEC